MSFGAPAGTGAVEPPCPAGRAMVAPPLGRLGVGVDPQPIVTAAMSKAKRTALL